MNYTWGMSVRVAIGVIALVGVSICGLMSTLTNWEMMDAVNAKLSKSEQFGAVWWYAPKTLRLHRDYRRLYPEGRLLSNVWWLFALMSAGLLISAWAFRVLAK